METKDKQKMYQEMKDTDLNRLSPGKYFGEAIVEYPNPEDGKKNITTKLSVYDGIAYGTAKVKGVEREVVATYPLLNFINNTAKTMKENIRKVLGITETRDVTPLEILQAYSTIKFIA